MKNLVLLSVMLLFIAPMFGLSNNAVIFLGLEQSCINLAMGGHAIGNVNIWHNSPLTSIANPATGAFREGVSWGFSEKDWLKDVNPNYSLNASLVNLGWEGVSLTLPSYKLSERSGVYFDLGNSSSGGISFHSYDNAEVYGLAFDAVRLAGKFIPIPFVEKHFSLSGGMNYLAIDSHLAPAGYLGANGKGESWDIGTAAKFKLEDNSGVNLEAVLAYTHRNAFDNKIDWGMEYKEHIWESESTGYALSAGLSAEKLLGSMLGSEYLFCENLVSVRYLTSTSNENGDVTKGYGGELGLLDTFFLRRGRYDDFSGEVVGSTWGYGIDLHYKDYVSISLNYAEYPGGGLMPTQEARDLNASLNIIKLSKGIASLLNSK